MLKVEENVDISIYKYENQAVKEKTFLFRDNGGFFSKIIKNFFKVSTVIISDPILKDNKLLDENLNVDNAILLHGLNGSADSTYIKGMVNLFLKNNCRVFCMNARGIKNICKTKNLAHIGHTDDLKLLVEHVLREYKGSIFIIGFSQGANWCTKYLGENCAHSRIKGAVSVCNPFNFNLLKQMVPFTGIFNRIVHYGMAKVYTTYLNKLLGEIVSGKNVHEINMKLRNMKVLTHNSLEEFYEESSSTNYIQNINVPLLFISAEDDPLIPIAVIPKDKITKNRNTGLILLKGGHLGFRSLFLRSSIEGIVEQFYKKLN
ncbi:hypothetical protein NUSPORA_00881 [Nucleospora cyclopteri]